MDCVLILVRLIYIWSKGWRNNLIIIDFAISPAWRTITKASKKRAQFTKGVPNRNRLFIHRRSKLSRFFSFFSKRNSQNLFPRFYARLSKAGEFKFVSLFREKLCASRLEAMAECYDCKAPPPSKTPPSTSTSTFFPPNLCRFPGSPLYPLNPGNISNLHKKTRDLMPQWIEGLSLRCAKNLDVHKTAYAEWMMGNSTPAGFRFGGMLCRKDDHSTTVNNSV